MYVYAVAGGQQRAVIAHVHPVRVQRGVLDAGVAAVDGVEVRVALAEVLERLGEFGRDSVHREGVSLVGQADGVEGEAAEIAGGVIDADEELVAELELLAADLEGQRGAPEVADLYVTLVEADVGHAPVVNARQVVRAKAVAPGIPTVELDKRRDVIGEVRLDPKAGALLNEGLAGKGIVVVVAAADAQVSAQLHVLEFGPGRAARYGNERAEEQQFLETHDACLLCMMVWMRFRGARGCAPLYYGHSSGACDPDSAWVAFIPPFVPKSGPQPR